MIWIFRLHSHSHHSDICEEMCFFLLTLLHMLNFLKNDQITVFCMSLLVVIFLDGSE